VTDNTSLPIAHPLPDIAGHVVQAKPIENGVIH